MSKNWLFFTLILAYGCVSVICLECNKDIKCADYKALKCKECINNTPKFRITYETFYNQIWNRRDVFLKKANDFIDFLQITDNPTTLKRRIEIFNNSTSKDSYNIKTNFKDILDFQNITDNLECFCHDKILKVSKLGRLMHNKIKDEDDKILLVNIALKDTPATATKNERTTIIDNLVTKAVDPSSNSDNLEDNRGTSNTVNPINSTSNNINPNIIQVPINNTANSLNSVIANNSSVNSNNPSNTINNSEVNIPMNSSANSANPTNNLANPVNSVNTNISPVNSVNSTNATNSNNPINSVNPINTINNPVNSNNDSVNSLNPINTTNSVNPTNNLVNPVNSVNTNIIPVNSTNATNSNNPINLVNPINTINNPVNSNNDSVNSLNPVNTTNSVNPTNNLVNPVNSVNTNIIPVNSTNATNSNNPINLVNPINTINNPVNSNNGSANSIDPANTIKPVYAINNSTLINPTEPVNSVNTTTIPVNSNNTSNGITDQNSGMNSTIVGSENNTAYEEWEQDLLTKKLAEYLASQVQKLQLEMDIQAQDDEVNSYLQQAANENKEEIVPLKLDFSDQGLRLEKIFKSYEKLINLNQKSVFPAIIDGLTKQSDLLNNKPFMDYTLGFLRKMGSSLKDPKIEENLINMFANLDVNRDLQLISGFGNQLKQLERNETVRNQLISLGSPENLSKLFNYTASLGSSLKNLQLNTKIRDMINSIGNPETIEENFKKIRAMGELLKTLENNATAKNGLKLFANDTNLENISKMVVNLANTLKALEGDKNLKSQFISLGKEENFDRNILLIKDLGERLKQVVLNKNLEKELSILGSSDNIDKALAMVSNLGDDLNKFNPNKKIFTMIYSKENVDKAFKFFGNLGNQLKNLTENGDLKNKLKDLLSNDNLDSIFKTMGYLGSKLRDLQPSQNLKEQLKLITVLENDKLDFAESIGDKLENLYMYEEDIRNYTSPENVDKTLKMIADAGKQLTSPELQEKIYSFIGTYVNEGNFDKQLQQISDLSNVLLKAEPELLMKGQKNTVSILKNVNTSLNRLHSLGAKLSDPKLEEGIWNNVFAFEKNLENITKLGEQFQNLDKNITLQNELIASGDRNVEGLEILFNYIADLGDYLKTIQFTNIKEQINDMGTEEWLSNEFKKIRFLGGKLEGLQNNPEAKNKLKILANETNLDMISKVMINIGEILTNVENDEDFKKQLGSLRNEDNFENNFNIIKTLAGKLKNVEKDKGIEQTLMILGTSKATDQALNMIRNLGDQLDKLQPDQNLKSLFKLLGNEASVKLLKNLGMQLKNVEKIAERKNLITFLVNDENIDQTFKALGNIGNQLQKLEPTQNLKEQLKNLPAVLETSFKFVTNLGDKLKNLQERGTLREQWKMLSTPENINKAIKFITNFGEQLTNPEFKNKLNDKLKLGEDDLEKNIQMLKNLGMGLNNVSPTDVLKMQIKLQEFMQKPNETILKALAMPENLDQAFNFIGNLGDKLKNTTLINGLKEQLKLFIPKDKLDKTFNFVEDLGNHFINLQNDKSLKDQIQIAASEGNIEKTAELLQNFNVKQNGNSRIKKEVKDSLNLNTLEGLQNAQALLSILMEPYRDIDIEKIQTDKLKAIISKTLIDTQSGLLAGMVENRMKEINAAYIKNKDVLTNNNEEFELRISKIENQLSDLQSQKIFPYQQSPNLTNFLNISYPMVTINHQTGTLPLPDINTFREVDYEDQHIEDIIGKYLPKTSGGKDLKKSLLGKKIKDFNELGNSEENGGELGSRIPGDKKKFVEIMAQVKDLLGNKPALGKRLPNKNEENVSSLELEINNEGKIDLQIFDKPTSKKSDKNLDEAIAYDLIKVAKTSATSTLQKLFNIQGIISDDIDKEFKLINLLEKFTRNKQLKEVSLY